jgi:nitrite reductase (NADH) large subunit
VYGLVQPIWEQCAVLADVLTGTNPRARYTGSKLYARLKVAGVEVASFGLNDGTPTDEVIQIFEDRRGVYRKLIVRDGKLVGGVLVGCAAAAPGLIQMFDRDERMPTNRLDVLASGLAPAVGAGGDREVCNCNHVSETTIIEAVRTGCDTVPAVCAATRAGTGCGSCKGQLTALVQKNAAELVG